MLENILLIQANFNEAVVEFIKRAGPPPRPSRVRRQEKRRHKAVTQNWIDKTIKLAPTPPSTASPLPPPTPSIEKLEDKKNVVMVQHIKSEEEKKVSDMAAEIKKKHNMEESGEEKKILDMAAEINMELRYSKEEDPFEYG